MTRQWMGVWWREDPSPSLHSGLRLTALRMTAGEGRRTVTCIEPCQNMRMPRHNKNEEKSFTFSIASLNTLGIPFLSPQPVDRYIVLCQEFERLRVDIINL